MICLLNTENFSKIYPKLPAKCLTRGRGWENRLTELDDSLENIRAVLSGEVRYKANLIKKEENVILDYEKALMLEDAENVEDPEFIKRVNIILGIGRPTEQPTATHLATAPPQSPAHEAPLNEWVSEGKKELMAKPNLMNQVKLSVAPAASVAVTNLATSTFSEFKNPGMPASHITHSSKKPPVEEVRVKYAGLEFTGRLISEDGQYCNVAFPDGRRSKILKSQVIR